MDRDEWSAKAGEELDEISSAANSVIQEMLEDGSWDGTDPVETAREVVASIVEAEETSAEGGGNE